MAIGETDRVLEIGSGGLPHPRSDVLVDRYPGVSPQRQFMELKRDGRSLVLADGQHLPFPGRSFDYVIASHVLEHVDDPAAFCRELCRVAPRGFIETPSELWSFLFDPRDEEKDTHRWYVTRRGRTLFLRRKTPEEKRFRFQPLFTYFRRHNPWFQRMMMENINLFFVQLEWRGRIGLKIGEEFPWARALSGEEPGGDFLAEFASNRDFIRNPGKHWLPDRSRLGWRAKEKLRRLLRFEP